MGARLRRREVVDRTERPRRSPRSEHARAKTFFDTFDAANRYAILYRIQTAKKPETRAERIERFVAMCARHETIQPSRKSKRRAGSNSKSQTDRG